MTGSSRRPPAHFMQLGAPTIYVYCKHGKCCSTPSILNFPLASFRPLPPSLPAFLFSFSVLLEGSAGQGQIYISLRHCFRSPNGRLLLHAAAFAFLNRRRSEWAPETFLFLLLQPHSGRTLLHSPTQLRREGGECDSTNSVILEL